MTDNEHLEEINDEQYLKACIKYAIFKEQVELLTREFIGQSNDEETHKNFREQFEELIRRI